MGLNKRLGVARLDVAELSGLLGAVLFDNADGILLIDQAGLILTVNPAAERLLGRLAGDLVGEPFGFPVATDTPTELNLVGVSSRVVEMQVARTVIRGEEAFVATLRDITARTIAEESLRNFVSMASHEFRTPITSIAGFSEMLLEQWEAITEDNKRQYLEIIRRQADRLSRMSTDLLSLSRLEEGRSALERSRTPIEPVVQQAIGAMRTSLEGLEVQVDVEQDLVVLVDPGHFEEMLINYLDNAVKYGRGPVVVRARRVPDGVEIEVADAGPGVPVDFRPSLFHRFARDRQTAGREIGSGLGLSIVAVLAERNGGRAWYRPGDPTGSRFGVSLPIS